MNFCCDVCEKLHCTIFTFVVMLIGLKSKYSAENAGVFAAFDVKLAIAKNVDEIVSTIGTQLLRWRRI